jgi:hypothetical protein
MTLATIAEAIAKLPPDQLARFRRWFAAFEAGRSDHAKELDSTAIKLGRLASRALAELKKRAKEPLSVPRTTAPMEPPQYPNHSKPVARNSVAHERPTASAPYAGCAESRLRHCAAGKKSCTDSARPTPPARRCAP